MKISSKYRERLATYLKWTGEAWGCFQRPPEVELAADGPSAAEAMLHLESFGERPLCCSEPSLLADYIQGKANRDFQINHWRLDALAGSLYCFYEELAECLADKREDAESVLTFLPPSTPLAPKCQAS